MDWDTINSAVIRAYKHAIVKRERLTRMTGTLDVYFTRSIRCAASSRIAAISCSSSSSSPSRPTRWLSAVIRFLTARPIAGPAVCSIARRQVAEPLEQRLDLFRALVEVGAALVGHLERLARRPRPAASSIRPMSWSRVSVG